MKNNKNITYLIVFIVLLLVIISSMSYAYFRVNTSSDSTIGGVIGNTECLDISYSESNVIDLDNQYPITDEYALNNLIPVTITVTNNCTNSINYVLTNTSLSENTGYIEDNKMRISVKRQKENSEEKTIVSPIYVTELENLTSGNTYTMLTNDLVNRPVIKDFTNKTSYVIDREEIEGNTTNMYKVYLWIDYWEGDTTHTGLNNNSTQNQSYKSAISLVANSEETPKYLVTFDPNEGSFANGVSNTKEVIYHQQYGELPVPTKEGYTFKGWNGKNIFDYEEILKSNSSTVSLTTLNDKNVISWINNSSIFSQRFLQGYFKENTIYTFSGKIASSKINNNIVIRYKDETYCYYSLVKYNTPNVFDDIAFTSSESKSINYFGGGNANAEIMYIDINSFQIEEGTAATEYEPYYVTSDVKVTQQKDHILKAIWEPVSE